MNKICILAYWYSPLQAVGALRAQSFVEYARENGFDAFAISIKPNGLCTPCALEKSIDEEREYSITGFDSNFLIRNLYWKFKGAKHSTVANQYVGSTGNRNTLLRFCKKVFYFIYRKIICFPDTHFHWYPLAKKQFIDIIEKENPDIVLTSAFPVSSFFFGAYLKKKYPHIKWVADYRDLWSQHQWYKRPWPLSILERALEKRVLKSSDQIITTSREFQQQLCKLHQRDVSIIYNGYDDDVNKCEYSSVKFIISYTGVLYDQQRPDIFFKALRSLISRGKIDEGLLQVDFYGKTPSYLNSLIKDANLSKCIKLHGIISKQEITAIQRRSNILLLICWDNGPIPVKLFEYLSARIPVLVLGQNNTESAEIINRSESGKVCATEKDVEDFLLNYFVEWKQTKKNKLVRVSKEILRFSRKNQAASLYDSIKNLIF